MYTQLYFSSNFNVIFLNCDKVDFLSVMVFKFNLIAVKLVQEEALVNLLWLYHAVFTVALYYPLANEVAKGYSNATVRPSFLPSVLP
jgi:hypothetical protein